MSIFEKNRGTKADPYEIWTEDDLFEFGSHSDLDNISTFYELKDDIEMTREWITPRSFGGTLDGDGHTISGMYINNGNFFNFLGGTIKNLTLKDTFIKTGSRTRYGAVAGEVNPAYGNGGTSVLNVTVSGFKVDTSSTSSTATLEIGGIAGRDSASSSSTTQVIGCLVEDMEVIGSISRGSAGGLFGYQVVSRRNFYDKNIVNGPISFPNASSWSNYTRHNGRIAGREEFRPNFGSPSFPAVNLGGGTNVVSDESDISLGSRRSEAYSDGSVFRNSNMKDKSSYSGYIDFGPEEAWDMVDGELPFLTYYGEKINPIKLSEFSDLDLIRNNPDGNFILTDDIDASGTSTYNVVFSVDFSGYLNGDGYSIYGINIYPNRTNNNGTLFNSISGHIKNLKLEFSRIQSANSSYSVGIMTTGNMSGKIESIHATVSGNFQGESNSGFAGSILDDGIVKNCYLSINYLRSSDTRSGLMGTMANYGKGVVRNNVIRINGAFRTYTLVRGSNLENVSDNVGRGSVSASDSGLIRTTNDDDFRNPDFHGYDNFDKDKWVFFTDEDPTPSPFYVILEKIEERLVSLYSKGISLKTRMSKGFKDIVKFFSKKSESDVSTRRIGNRLEINFSETISSKFSRSGKKLRDIKNYTGRALSNLIKSINVNKRVGFYTEDILSKINNVKKSMKSSINKMNKINFNAYSVVVKRYFIGVMTYSKEIMTSSSWTKLTRMIKTAKSYTRRVRSLVWRFTNVYEFVIRRFSSYSSPVSSNVVKYSVIKRLSQTYAESISSYSRRLVKRGMSALKYARVNVRYNNIKMRVKESMTKIRAFSGGGD